MKNTTTELLCLSSPKQYKNEIISLFNSFPYRDFQIKKLGIKKEEMLEYLWNTVVSHKGISCALLHKNKLKAFSFSVVNRLVTGKLGVNSHSLRHFLISPDVDISDRSSFLAFCIDMIKQKKGHFVDFKAAAPDTETIALFQHNNFKTVSGTINCLIKSLEKEPYFNGNVDIEKAKQENADEIHRLVCKNHAHNHYNYDTSIPHDKIGDLYGTLVTKTLKMNNTTTLAAKNRDTGKIEGVISFKTNPAISLFSRYNFASLDFIAVDSNCRSKGLGDFLNRAALREINKQGIEKVVVRTMYSNYAAIAILQKLGMRITSSDMIFHKWL
ncbi:MAG: GNAT family N-acetyltransferase [bacterium]